MKLNKICLVVIVIIVVFVIWLNLRTPRAETTRSMFEEIKLSTLDTKLDFENEGFKIFNPSISKTSQQHVMTFRCSNFTNCKSNSLLDRFSNFKKLSKRNFKSHVVLRFEASREMRLIDVELEGSKFDALEDVRPLEFKQSLILTGSARDSNDRMRMMFGVYDELRNRLSLKKLHIKNSEMLKEQRDEKNWMPFVMNDELMFVYSVNPHVILRCEVESGECVEVHRKQYDMPENIRGGHVAEHEGDYYGVVHTRVSANSYLTRFYKFDRNFEIVGVTDPFTFSDKPKYDTTQIQFASGILIEGDDVIVTYGEQDCESKVCVLKLKHLQQQLKAVKARDVGDTKI